MLGRPDSPAERSRNGVSRARENDLTSLHIQCARDPRSFGCVPRFLVAANRQDEAIELLNRHIDSSEKSTELLSGFASTPPMTTATAPRTRAPARAGPSGEPSSGITLIQARLSEAPRSAA